MKFLFICLFLIAGAWANSNDLSHRPKSFNTSSGTAVFVDFTHATYHLTYDIDKKRSNVLADIRFRMPEAGRPIFDSVAHPTSVLLNGEKVSSSEVSTPSNETKVRILNREVSEGIHRMTIEIPLLNLVNFSSGGVKSAFWNSDLNNRGFLERYLPANFEFDQVKMDFVVKFIGGRSKQKIYTNGDIQEHSPSVYSISYPEYFNSSSIFFHTVPEHTVNEMRFNIKSIDGRNIPTIVYSSKNFWGSSSDLNEVKQETVAVVNELEADYGPFPHPTITIYNAGSGGMEYAGATMSEIRAIGHELFHSYFARGVMPANGNSGWLDEALASWRDKGYRRSTSLSGTSRMSALAYYTRYTDYTAYSFGEQFMSYMDGKLEAKGGLKPFMRYMVKNRLFAPLFVEEFMQEMTNFYGISVEEDFYKYTFGNQSLQNASLKMRDIHPMHQKMTMEELYNHL
jgi:hypothetical protein